MAASKCYHCGSPCESSSLQEEDKWFCCLGCLSVYRLLREQDLLDYYRLSPQAGTPVSEQEADLSFLDEQDVKKHFLLYESDTRAQALFSIPQIHCPSCVYLLEEIYRFLPGIFGSEVNFLRRTLKVEYHPQQVRLSQVAQLLTQLGYRPDFSWSLEKERTSHHPKGYLLRLGLTFFAWGNIMLFAFPEYLAGRDVPDHFRQFFQYASLLLAIPIMFYSALPWHKGAVAALKAKRMTMDVPISLGLWAMFLQSLYEILSGTGQGYLDSLASFVLFLLVAQYLEFWQFQRLSRGDGKGLFPLAVLTQREGQWRRTYVGRLQEGDVIRLLSQEVVPHNCQLLSERGSFDWSFLSGESAPLLCKKGEKIPFGVQVVDGPLELQVCEVVPQSHWQIVWEEKEIRGTFLEHLSPYFITLALGAALGGFLFWSLWYGDFGAALSAMTFSLIIFCPCALVVGSSFASGTLAQLLERQGLYLKNGFQLDLLAKVDTVVLDKTGTLTDNRLSVERVWERLSPEQVVLFFDLASRSLHPVSQAVGEWLRESCEIPSQESLFWEEWEEVTGAGLRGRWRSTTFLLGQKQWVLEQISGVAPTEKGEVYLACGEDVVAVFQLKSQFREGVERLAQELAAWEVHLLTGDSERDRAYLETWFPGEMHFRMSPEAKAEYVRRLAAQGRKVLFVGDGWNDRGAMAESWVSLAVGGENGRVLPCAQGIVEGRKVPALGRFLAAARGLKWPLRLNLTFSLCYNGVGLFYALTLKLSPLVAAILMPLSSFSVLLLSTLGSFFVFRKYVGRQNYGSHVSPHRSESPVRPVLSRSVHLGREGRPV